METIEEKIQKLADKGFGLNVATTYYWDELTTEEKSQLKFRQLLWLWKECPNDALVKKDFWRLLEQLVLTFDEKLLLWENTLSGTKEELGSWTQLKDSAYNFERRKIIFKKISIIGDRKCDIWELIKEVAKSPQELTWN